MSEVSSCSKRAHIVHTCLNYPLEVRNLSMQILVLTVAILLCPYDSAVVLMRLRHAQLYLSEIPFILLSISTSLLVLGSTHKQSARPGNHRTDRRHCPAVRRQDTFFL